MNNLTKTTLKTFFYNLIFFDFIFLTSFNKKVANTFLQKTLFFKKKSFFRLSIFELLKSFKLFIRLFYFLSKHVNAKKLLLYIWCTKLQDIQFLNFFLNKYKIGIFFEISHLFPNINKKFDFFKNVLVLDQQLKSNDYKNFFFRNLYLIQRIDTFENFKSWGSYKIHNDLNGIKKLILFGLILVQVFKK